MTAHVAITYLPSNVSTPISVQAVPIGGTVPPIRPPQAINPGQSVEFDIEPGYELVIVTQTVPTQRPVSVPRPQYQPHALSQSPAVDYPQPLPTTTTYTGAEPKTFVAGSQGFAIPPLKGTATAPVSQR